MTTPRTAPECDLTNSIADSPTISTVFYIAGWDFDPVECTEAIGLQPTDVWRQARQELLNRRDVPNTSWNISRKARPHYSLSEALDEVLELVWPSRDRIKVFAKDKDLRIGVTCTVKILTDRPLYDLRVKSISRLADLQSEFFLDIMDYSE